jgi:hypothetical protein
MEEYDRGIRHKSSKLHIIYMYFNNSSKQPLLKWKLIIAINVHYLSKQLLFQ